LREVLPMTLLVFKESSRPIRGSPEVGRRDLAITQIG
jgi:hypothetical protein